MDMLKEKFRGRTNEELLEEYHRTHDLDIKKEITFRHLNLMKDIVIHMRNIYSNYEQVDDMINEGVIVLMKSIDKYDPARNISFSTYVFKRIRGMVIDRMRSQCWIPRDILRKLNQINEGNRQLFARLGRSPTDQEMADYLKIPLEEYIKSYKNMMVRKLVSLQVVMKDKDSEVHEQTWDLPAYENTAEEGILKEELRQHLIEGIEELNENEKTVVSLHYQEELTLKEISEIMNLSAPRVSQIHAKAIGKLRKYLQEKYE